MSKRGENIRKRSDGRWEARVLLRNGNKPTYHSIYGHSYREVREKKELFIKQSALPEQITVKPKTITMEQILNSWILDRELFLKKSTILKYKNIIEMHIMPEFRDMDINDINSDIINQFLVRKQETGRIDGKGGLSNSYIKSIAIILSSCLNYAVANGIRTPLPGKVAKPSVNKHEIVVLNKEVQREMERKLLPSDSLTELGILLALNAGLRIGEVCALKWKDIDFTNRIIHIRQSIVRVSAETNTSERKTVLIVDTPKSPHSVRDIPINSKLYEILEDHKSSSSMNYIMSGTSKFVSPRTFEYRFHKVLRKHNMKDFNFHTLRHTFATRCIECGVDVKSLSEIMGHSNVNITLNNYVHPSFENKRLQLEKINDL